MRILQISNTDINGGAGRACYRLNCSLNKNGVVSEMLVLHKKSKDERVIKYQTKKNYISRSRILIKQLINRRKIKKYKINEKDYEMYSAGYSKYHVNPFDFKKYDMINLHWVSNFIDIYSFFPLMYKQKMPVIWTLHDMNAFTGGCHYTDSCNSYKSLCGNCPCLNSDDQNDLSHIIFKKKLNLFKNYDPRYLSFITPSKWLSKELSNSKIFRSFDSTVIPSGIDINMYKPVDKLEARSSLGLPRDKTIILFVADSPNIKRKGIKYFHELRHSLLSKNDIFFVSVGKHKGTIDKLLNYKHINHVKNDETLRRVYSASDFFIITSIQDNLPNTVLESLSCGTPVLGFKIGGIAEMVENNYNGFLVNLGDINSLKNIILEYTGNKEFTKKLSANSRNSVIEKFSSKLQAERYFMQYKEKLNKIN